MRNELHLARRLRRLALAVGLTLAGASAFAQDAPPPPASGVSYPAPSEPAGPGAGPDAGAPAPAPESGGRHSRGEIRPYLEVQQVLSADLGNGGDTLTYTSVAAGVDGHVETRRVQVQASLRYERDIDWNGHVQQQDNVSGIATVHAEVAPGAVAIDAGGLATRTGGPGRVFGVTNRDDTVDVYSAYAGPTLSTHAGPVAVNGAYRFGYTHVNDHSAGNLLAGDYNSSTAHSLTGSIGMGTRDTGLPFGWTVGGGAVRETTNDMFRHRFEGEYVRGDLVVPVGPTLALTGGIGYERIRSSQRDFVRDAAGVPVPDAQGRPQADPNAPRQLTYDTDGLMYDGGIIYRPTPRTELQARAGHRYGGTTYMGTLTHQIGRHAALNVAVYDTVETFGHQLSYDLSALPANFNPVRNSLTGGLEGCAFGQNGGGGCLDRSLQAITGDTFRARGVLASLSGSRGLWSYGIGASYNRRHYFRPTLTGVTVLGATHDEDVGVYGTVSRRLSRTSTLTFDAYASWYDNDLANSDAVTSEGASVSYSRTFMLERLQFLAALGLLHSDNGTNSSTIGSASAGLRYTF
ncbi:MAG: hypothetical protein JO276_02670 [Sphingomonadaceae bacterium]|nr:hypothetical protein [Sphingomonadaceae bacterium]